MQIETVTEKGNTVVKPKGKLTVQTSPELDAAIKQLPSDICDLDIDLSRVDYIASAGLRVLASVGQMTTLRGGKMRLLHPDANVMEALEMTGLSQILAIER